MMKSIARSITFLILAGFAQSCGNPIALQPSATSSTAGSYRETLWNEPAVRIIFHRDNFTNLEDFRTSKHTQYQCLGDATKYYSVTGDDYKGTATAFPNSTSVSDDFTVSTHPAFLKAVAVDITQTYFNLTKSNIIQTDRCSYRGVGGAPPPSSCADFDRAPAADPAPTIAPTSTPVAGPSPVAPPTTTQYYSTDFYRVRDDWCSGQGPILSSDPETTKAYVGGVSIDLDRTELSANEDLLMVMTYHSLTANYNAAGNWPGIQTVNDTSVLKVNLVSTGLDFSTLLQTRQPRNWTFYQNTSYPVYWQEVASLEDPFGSLRTEQVYLPISKNIHIDRIRIDRARGSFHLYQVDLYRLGNRGP